MDYAVSPCLIQILHLCPTSDPTKDRANKLACLRRTIFVLDCRWNGLGVLVQQDSTRLQDPDMNRGLCNKHTAMKFRALVNRRIPLLYGGRTSFFLAIYLLLMVSVTSGYSDVNKNSSVQGVCCCRNMVLFCCVFSMVRKLLRRHHTPKRLCSRLHIQLHFDILAFLAMQSFHMLQTLQVLCFL